MVNLAEWIRKAGKEQRVVEFQYPFVPDFYVKVAYASKSILSQIREASKEFVSDLRTRVKEERLNDEKLRREYAMRVIKDWRGLTGAKLPKVVPGIVLQFEGGEVKADADIPYSVDIAVALLEVSIEFENWVLDMATNIENYSKIAEAKEVEYKNLS